MQNGPQALAHLLCIKPTATGGELTVPSQSKFNPAHHITQTGTIHDFLITSDRRHLKFHIPWSKTTREQGADVIASSNITALCPCEAFELHWSWNQAVPDGFSLFAFIDEHGTPRHMTKSKFLKFVTSIWNSAGMKHVLGHSF
ncbi:hypothetical protein EV361DRAFT_975613 [Lentinula raphanica]|nr:hypothetical protein EV361DRAFT_975613 [Lentinula raphanica]